MAHGIRAALPPGLVKLGLPTTNSATVAVFLSQWRDSSWWQALYDGLSARIASELQVTTHISSLSPDDVANCVTFVDLERVVANGLRDMLLDNHAQSVAADIRRIASGRMADFWANTRFPDTEYQVSFYSDPVDAAFKAMGVE